MEHKMKKMQRRFLSISKLVKRCNTFFLSLAIGASAIVFNGCPCDNDPQTICLRFGATDGCTPSCGGPATIIYNDGQRNNASVWNTVLPHSPAVDATVCISGVKRAGSISVSWTCYDADGKVTSFCASRKMTVPAANCDNGNTTLNANVTCYCFK